MSVGRKVSALVGFIVLGISPSYVDWLQSPDKRKGIVIYYALALALIYYGLLSG